MLRLKLIRPPAPKGLKVGIISIAAISAIGTQPLQAKESRYFEETKPVSHVEVASPQLTAILPHGQILFFGLGGSVPSNSGKFGEVYNNTHKVVLYDVATGNASSIVDCPFELDQHSQVLVLPSAGIMIACPFVAQEVQNFDFSYHRQLEEQAKMAPLADNPKLLIDALRPQFDAAKALRSAILSRPAPDEELRKTSALLYEPTTQKYTLLFNAHPMRFGATSTVLADRKILIIGGNVSRWEHERQQSESKHVDNGIEPVSSVQIFDPVDDSIQKIGELPTSITLYDHTTTPLGNNQFLIIGGFQSIADPEHLSESERAHLQKDIFRYDLGRNTFEKVGQLVHARARHEVIALGDDKFLIVGGNIADPLSGNSRVELFDLKTRHSKIVHAFFDGWNPDHKVSPVRLPDGHVLFFIDSLVGLYEPELGSVRKIDELPHLRLSPNIIATPDGQIFSFGGYKWDYRGFDSYMLNDDYVERFRYDKFRENYDTEH